MLFHFELVGAAKSGFIGVDIFFVISGFLITSIVVSQMDRGEFSLKEFYIKRIRRLAPALFATLVMVLIAGWLWLFPQQFKDLVFQVFASQFYFSNIYYWLNINYFGLRAHDVYLLHTWSLAVEEQFYLLYPIVLLGILRFCRRYIVAILILGIAVSYLLNVAFVTSKPEATFYLLPTRAWELLSGAIIYFLKLDWPHSKFARNFVGSIGFGLIIIAVLAFNEEIKFPGYFAALPVTGAVCLLIAGRYENNWTYRFLSLPPLVYIGKISYPLYLVHWPVNIFARLHLEDKYTMEMRAFAFVLSILLSALIFHVVENPIRREHIYVSSNRIVRSYLIILITTLFVSFSVYKADGFPLRFPADAVQLAEFVGDVSEEGQRCRYKGSTVLQRSGFCKIGASNQDPQWLIYGDSHAAAGYNAFDLWLKKTGQAGIFIFVHSCPPLKNVYIFRGKGACKTFNDAIFEYLASDKIIQNVLLVSIWRYGRAGRLSTSSDLKMSKLESRKLFGKQLNETIVELNTIGKNVYIWEPVPGAKSNVPIALAKSRIRNEPDHISFSKEEYLSANSGFFSELEKNRKLIIKTISPSEALCGSGECAVTINGLPAYTDSDHISKSASLFWASTIVRQLK